MFENLIFGKTCVFEKLCISFSCILLIFFNAWRILCKNCFFFFSKLCFFLEFRSIEAVFRSIEIVSKFFDEPLSVSINRNLWIRFFFLKLSLTCSNSLFKSFSNFSFSLRLSKGFFSIFCCFPSIFLQSFPLSKPVSPFYPSFCIYFHVFMHFVGIFRNFLFGIFIASSHIFWNWSLGFAAIML